MPKLPPNKRVCLLNVLYLVDHLASLTIWYVLINLAGSLWPLLSMAFVVVVTTHKL